MIIHRESALNADWDIIMECQRKDNCLHTQPVNDLDPHHIHKARGCCHDHDNMHFNEQCHSLHSNAESDNVTDDDDSKVHWHLNGGHTSRRPIVGENPLQYHIEGDVGLIADSAVDDVVLKLSWHWSERPRKFPYKRAITITENEREFFRTLQSSW